MTVEHPVEAVHDMSVPAGVIPVCNLSVGVEISALHREVGSGEIDCEVLNQTAINVLGPPVIDGENINEVVLSGGVTQCPRTCSRNGEKTSAAVSQSSLSNFMVDCEVADSILRLEKQPDAGMIVEHLVDGAAAVHDMSASAGVLPVCELSVGADVAALRGDVGCMESDCEVVDQTIIGAQVLGTTVIDGENLTEVLWGGEVTKCVATCSRNDEKASVAVSQSVLSNFLVDCEVADDQGETEESDESDEEDEPDSSSESSSDDSDEEDGAHEKLLERKGNRGNEDENLEPLRTKNELAFLPPVPKVEAVLEPHHKLESIGFVSSVLDLTVVVEGLLEKQILNEGSILWLTQSKIPLGFVDEVFGPVKKPFYIVRFNEKLEIPECLATDADVSFVSEYANFVLDNPNLYKKGVDASGLDDEELSDGEVDFSDDEKEAEAKQRRGKVKRDSDGTEKESGHSKSVPEVSMGETQGRRSWRGKGRGRGSFSSMGRALDADDISVAELDLKGTCRQSFSDPQQESRPRGRGRGRLRPTQGRHVSQSTPRHASSRTDFQGSALRQTEGLRRSDQSPLPESSKNWEQWTPEDKALQSPSMQEHAGRISQSGMGKQQMRHDNALQTRVTSEPMPVPMQVYPQVQTWAPVDPTSVPLQGFSQGPRQELIQSTADLFQHHGPVFSQQLDGNSAVYGQPIPAPAQFYGSVNAGHHLVRLNALGNAQFMFGSTGHVTFHSPQVSNVGQSNLHPVVGIPFDRNPWIQDYQHPGNTFNNSYGPFAFHGLEANMLPNMIGVDIGRPVYPQSVPHIGNFNGNAHNHQQLTSGVPAPYHVGVGPGNFDMNRIPLSGNGHIHRSPMRGVPAFGLNPDPRSRQGPDNPSAG